MTAREYVHHHKKHGDLKRIAKASGYKYNTIRCWSAGQPLPFSTEAKLVAAMKEVIAAREPEPQY